MPQPFIWGLSISRVRLLVASPAGPEDRHLVSMSGDRVARVGSTSVGDPDGLRTAGVDGAAMGVRIACCQLTDQLDLCFRDRAHGHYHWSVKAAGSTAGEAGDEHRHTVPSSTFRTLTPASIKACSKVRLQPSRKETRSSRQRSRISPRCSTSSPGGIRGSPGGRCGGRRQGPSGPARDRPGE